MTPRLLSLAFLLPAPALAGGEIGTDSPPPAPPQSCVYYEDFGFGGASEVIPEGELRRYLGDAWNDRISSIACDPGCELQVWEYREATGGERRFSSGTYYVGDDWNDIISAARVVCEAAPPPDPALPPASEPVPIPEPSGGDCTYGPATCTPGYVWRGAGPEDVVCVRPEVRARSQEENAYANARRLGFGPSGPDTCLSGYVWREAFPGDTVCVSPESRVQVMDDNAQAPFRDACPD